MKKNIKKTQTNIKKAQAEAKKLGHCLCNIKLKCPCVAYTKFKKCKCSES